MPHVELTAWTCHVREIRSDGIPGAKKELLKNCFVCQAVCVTLILLFDLNLNFQQWDPELARVAQKWADQCTNVDYKGDQKRRDPVLFHDTHAHRKTREYS